MLLSLDDDGLPLGLRKFTALAPLGSATALIGNGKLVCTGASCLSGLAATLAHDLAEGATGQGGYPISGDLRPEIFRDDCRFVDPTNDVASLSRYQKALTILFEPSLSSVRLVEGPAVDEASRTIKATIRSVGVLKLPWKPVIKPWESYLVWTIDDTGLISEQAQTWNITAADALLQTFGVTS